MVGDDNNRTAICISRNSEVRISPRVVTAVESILSKGQVRALAALHNGSRLIESEHSALANYSVQASEVTSGKFKTRVCLEKAPTTASRVRGSLAIHQEAI